ncbi:hypothetical protein H5410_028011 [Solanum commersonii]|uniref:Multifunctional fusion protein n=1 Tax=Solanum commersonii TaxID=4109 RepID=A0A9J5Z3R4_SOLCO|nr:hypothetical protein H5410_028011 [Solanum commersonii]
MRSALLINSCYAHCQTEVQETWYRADSPKLANKTIAKALGDWFYDKNPFQKIDCPYPCDNLVFYPNAHTFDIDRSQNGWHCGIQKVDPLGSSTTRQKYCENEQLPSITNMATIDGFLDIEAEAMQKGKRAFFIDGPGGTGKSFLYRALLATVRYRGFIALATASSGVAASLLPGGRPAHSFFSSWY